MVSAVRRKHAGSGIRFIHVEIYEGNDPAKGENKWVKEWKLPSEPWVFLVGPDGRCASASRAPCRCASWMRPCASHSSTDARPICRLAPGIARKEGRWRTYCVTTEWLAKRLGDAGLVVAEVDENPDLYEQGHIPGAVKLHWRDDLQDPIERDIVEKAEFERLLGLSAGSGTTPRSSSTATRTTGSPRTRTGT